MSNSIITPCMASNLLIKSIVQGERPEQRIGQPYTIPDEKVRYLCAELILEEAIETARALGFSVSLGPVLRTDKPDLEKIIDGCCDTVFVATGAMAACGVPDVPHLQEVFRANEEKFPGGKATFNEFGKYLKPEGWEGPDHEYIKLFQTELFKAKIKPQKTLVQMAEDLREDRYGKGRR